MKKALLWVMGAVALTTGCPLPELPCIVRGTCDPPVKGDTVGIRYYTGDRQLELPSGRIELAREALVLTFFNGTPHQALDGLVIGPGVLGKPQDEFQVFRLSGTPGLVRAEGSWDTDSVYALIGNTKHGERFGSQARIISSRNVRLNLDKAALVGLSRVREDILELAAPQAPEL